MENREQSSSPLMKNGDLGDAMAMEYAAPPRRKKPPPILPVRVYKKLSEMGLIRVTTWFVLTVAISIFGAFVYRVIEWEVDEQIRVSKYEEAVQKVNNREGNLTQLMNSLLDIRSLPRERRGDLIRELFTSYEESIGIDTTPPVMRGPGWTFQNSMFFCCSLYNSIGFGGRLFPLTTSGQVVTMIYSFVGIPFMLAMTSDLGLVVFEAVYYFWWKWKQLLLLRPGAAEARKRRLKEAENIELLKKEETTFPLMGGILMSVASLAFCSGCAQLIEPAWSYFDANYYYVTSFLTIGLGDISPSAPKRGPEWTLLPHTILLIFCMTFIGSIQHILSRRIELVYAYIENSIDMHFRDMSVSHRRMRGRLTEKVPTTGDDVDEEEDEAMDMSKTASFHIGRLAGKLGAVNRFYYAMMDQSRSRLLQEIWYRKANMKNVTNQTNAPKRDVGCQHLSPVDDEFDIATYGDYIDPEYYPKPKAADDIKLVKYVYHVND